MSGAVVPLSDLSRRIPLVGKLKAGVYKSGRPQAIDTWRLTTSSREFADDFAERYGGETRAFANPNSPHRWEVISETSEVSIALLGENGYSIAYELWKQGGCQRRCDGVTAEVIQTTGPDDVEYVPSPCICDRKQELECSLKSRLTMILPDLPFRGGVVYETGSKNFAEESQGMLALLAQMQASGVTKGKLRLEQRKSSGGRKFTIAVVGIEQSPEAIVSGMTGMRSLGSAPEQRPELSSPTGGDAGSGPSQLDPASTSEVGVVTGEGTAPAPGDPDEDIVDAEIIDDPDDDVQEVDEAPDQQSSADPDQHISEHGDPSERSSLIGTFQGIVKGAGLDYKQQVRPFLEAHYGVTLSGLPIDKLRALVSKLNDGSQHDKQEARKRFKVAVQEHTEAAA